MPACSVDFLGLCDVDFLLELCESVLPVLELCSEGSCIRCGILEKRKSIVADGCTARGVGLSSAPSCPFSDVILSGVALHLLRLCPLVDCIALPVVLLDISFNN